MKRHRLFVAINIPEIARKRLLREVEEWSDLPVKWTKEQNIHVTLLFIGYADDEELTRIVEALPSVAEGAKSFEVALNRIGIGPNARSPRMVWAEGEPSMKLADLQKRVENGIFDSKADSRTTIDVDDDAEPESDSRGGRPFRLHVTLGRILTFKWTRLKEKPNVAKQIKMTFPVNSIELMESELAPGGPVYTVL